MNESVPSHCLSFCYLIISHNGIGSGFWNQNPALKTNLKIHEYTRGYQKVRALML